MKIDDLIDETHLARTVWQFVEAMDFSPLYAQVRAVEGKPGSPAIDFKILTAIWLYAKLDGETSARRIANYCKEYAPYIWLCGGVTLNHHTLSDFETGHYDWMEAQFVNHLASMVERGLVELERVAQDGIRVRASAGAASFRRKQTLEECLAEAKAYQEQLQRERDEDPQIRDKRKQAAQERAAREHVERIQEAIRQLPEVEAKKKAADREKARVSTTDPDARVMKMADGGFRPALNIQFATDTGHQIITGFDVTNEGSDQNQLSPMLEQIHENTGKYPDVALVDGGFTNKQEIENCTAKEIVIYGPVSKPKDKTRDPYQPLDNDSQAVADWRKRMGTEEAKEIYKERAATAECVNAIARNRGLRQFTVRGLKKVKAALLWFVLAHNLLREAVLRPVAA
jgi:transposase